MGLLPIRHVIAGEGDGVCPLGKLHLKYHHRAKAESDLAQNEIEFPHAAEPFVKECHNALTISHGTLTPVTEGLCVVQTQNFDVGDNKARTLYGREDLGKRRNIRPGKIYLRMNGLIGPGASEYPIECNSATPPEVGKSPSLAKSSS